MILAEPQCVNARALFLLRNGILSHVCRLIVLCLFIFSLATPQVFAEEAESLLLDLNNASTSTSTEPQPLPPAPILAASPSITTPGILTPTGHTDITQLSVGDQVIGFDDETNTQVTNTVEKIEIITPKHYNYWEQDEEGTYTRLVEVPFTFYRINNQYELFKDQSILANGRVVHASELHIGDTLTNSDGEHILIDSITETTSRTSWVKLSVSGNHTYIEDGLVLHNASRYWVGGGSNANWSANANTNWGSASNTRDNASIPGASDDVFFDGVGFGNSPSTLSASISINSLDMTGYVNTLTHNSSVILTIAGNTFKLSSGMTYTLVSSSTPAVSFTSTTGTSGTPTMITTNGKFLGNTTFNGLGGYFTLQDSLSLSTTATLTHTAGTFDANNQNVTVGLFSSSNSNVRTLTAGSGTWNITGSGTTVWTTSTATNLTLTTRPTLNFTYAGSVGTRTITSAAFTEDIAPNINVTAGTDIVAPTNSVNNLNFTGFTGTLSSGNRTVYGNLTFGAGMTITNSSNNTTMAATSGTKTITSNGVLIALNLTVAGVGGTFQLADDLTLDSARTFTLTNGTFDANDKNVSMGLFSSTNANVRTITPGSGTWNITGSGTSVWTTSTFTNLTLTTRPTLNFAYAGSVGTRTILTGALPESMAPNINITAGTDIVSVTTNIGDLNFTGFAGTLAANTRTVYGNLTLAPGMTITAGSNGTTLAATSGTKTITSNGLSWNLPLIINGVGGTFQLADDLTLESSRALTLTAGTFDANNKNVSIGLFSSSNSNVRTLTPGSGTWNITGSGTIVWTTSTVTGLTMTARPTLNFTYSGGTGTRTITTGALDESVAPNINITAGTDTVSLTSNVVGDLNFTGFAGTLSGGTRTVYGNLTYSSAMTITSGGGATTMAATSGTKTLTSNGQTLNIPIYFNGAGATFELADDFNTTSLRSAGLLGGTLDLKGHNLTGGFTLFMYSSTTLRLQGNETISFVGKAVEAGSTVIYYGTSNYSNLAFGNRYGNVTFAGSGGSWTLDDSVNIAGNLNINNGSTLDVSTNNYTVSVAGDFVNNGTFVSRLGTVVMNNAGNQTLHPGTATFRNLAINDGLVAHYRFDDAVAGVGSTVLDSSPFGNTGTLSGTSTPQPSDSTPRVNFANTKSLSFDGTNYVDTGDDVSMKISLPISWCTWVYITDPSANNILIKGEFNDTQYYGITTYVTTTGDINMQFGNGNSIGPGGRASGITVNSPITANVWHHVCGVFRGKTDMSIYVNGASQGLTYDGSGNTVAYSSASGAIGSRSYTGQTNLASGSYLDDVRIYNRALSATEISALASGQEYSTPENTSTTLDGDITVTGDLSINRSTLDVSSSNYDIHVAGNWINNHGTFVPRKGTVTLDGTSQAMRGGTDFYNLYKTVSTPTVLTFDANTTQTVTGALTLRGSADGTLALRSTTPGTQWAINPQGSRNIRYLDVQDSNNVNSTPMVSESRQITDSGNNIRWGFAVSPSSSQTLGGYIGGSAPVRDSYTSPTSRTTNSEVNTSMPATASTFTRDLSIGKTHSDVLRIQKLLNKHGFVIATKGVGSPGRETTYFGPATKAAIIKLQLKYKIIKNTKDPSAGRVGPATRRVLNDLLVK